MMDHGKAILCYHCSKSAAGKRDMIKCDFCPNYWHLDCLDPPAPLNPSTLTANYMARRAWKCPLHADLEFKEVKYITSKVEREFKRKRATSLDEGSDSEGDFTWNIARHRIRRPKVLTPQDVALPRGNTNSGIIDVARHEEDSDDDEDWVYDDKLPRPEDGVLKKLPKQTIVADFLSAVKRRRLDSQRFPRVIVSLEKKAPAPMGSRSMLEQQTALVLTQIAEKQADSGLTGENVGALVGNLIVSLTPSYPFFSILAVLTQSQAEAPADVLALVAQDEQAEQKVLLERLQALIGKKLAEMNGAK